MNPPTDIPEDIRNRVRHAARDRCGYCLSPQRLVMSKLELEHIIPRARGGSDDESNLWLSCSLCNRHKAARVTGIDPLDGATARLFDPRAQTWAEHFKWGPDGISIVGLTTVGRATVDSLRLNNEIAVEVRRNWVLAGWYPPLEEG
jgi:hypothetical protein